MVCVEGTYANNQLDGPGAITYVGGDVLHCMFSNGYVQGPAKLFHHSKEGTHQLKMASQNVVTQFGSFSSPKLFLKNSVQVGWYTKGMRYGLVWNFLVGGGFLVGHTDIMG